MADIELVIKIPEHYYENNIKKDLPIYLTEDNIIAILPKKHGRLVDADKIKYFESSLVPHIYSDIVVRKEFIDAMPTILDAEVDNADSN